MEQIRKDYGLDLPLWQQLLKYLARVVVLDLGHSILLQPARHRSDL